jgi:hypothetical protein
MNHGNGVPGHEEKTIDSVECFREGFGLVEIKQHSVIPIAPPGFHLVQFAGRVDNLNAIDSLKLGDDFAVEPRIRTRGLLLFRFSIAMLVFSL